MHLLIGRGTSPDELMWLSTSIKTLTSQECDTARTLTGRNRTLAPLFANLPRSYFILIRIFKIDDFINDS
jgi:hypothetical protein